MGSAAAHAKRLVVVVLARVPAMIAEVEAAEEGEAAIDDDELLVVRAFLDVAAVEPERDALVRRPVEEQRLHPLALEREDHVEVPREDADLELGAPFAERVEEGLQRDGPSLALGRLRVFAAERAVS